jgi:uncharacterized protein YbjT (DUF2867 family)
MPEYYEIKIKGHLDPSWSDWFASLKLTHLERDVTLLAGLLPDQAALHGLLERIRDLNLTLISVASGDPFTPDIDENDKKKNMKTLITDSKIIKELNAEDKTNMQKIILVIGGTGTLGQPVSNSLKEAGFQVRVMTRDLQKTRMLFNNSFEIFVGDPIDTGCLEEALDGCYGVHISLPTEIEQQVAEKVARMAAKHGVERITYISGATVAEEHRWFPMINRKFLAEKAIKESGIPYTIFCPTWVMDGLPMFINQGQAFVFGRQPCPYHWVAAEDIARMVSAAYQLEKAVNKRFIVHGPEAIRLSEALRRYCAVFRPEIKKVSSMPFWLIKLMGTIMGNQELKGAGEMMAYFEKVGEGSNLPQVNDIWNVPMVTLDTWLHTQKVIES